jgi:hypothetical protein
VCRFHVAAGEKLHADKLSGAIVRSVAKLAGINLRKCGSFSYWFDKPWFQNWGKLAAVLIIPSSWGSQLGAYYAPSPSISCIWRCTSVIGGVRRQRGLRLCVAAGAHSSPTAALTVWYVWINPPSKLLLVHRAANAPTIMCLFANANFLLFYDLGVIRSCRGPDSIRVRGRCTKTGSIVLWRAYKQISRFCCPRTEFTLSPPTNRIHALSPPMNWICALVAH